jgi:predicted HAD superfamily Cof-like phosphohydrolase
VTNFEMVKEFHAALGHQDPDSPTPLSPEREELRRRLLSEEFFEVLEALEDEGITSLAKELADLLYVTYGMAAEAGLDMDRVFAEVHASNMTKVGGPRREDGKFLKGDHYRAPDLSWVAA